MSKITDIARKNMNKQLYKDFFFICFGIMLYGFGYTAFILPEQVVMGGVAGISALLFYAFGFPPAISIWVLNVSLLLIAFRALTRQFTIRTIIGVCDYRRSHERSRSRPRILAQWFHWRHRHHHSPAQQTFPHELRAGDAVHRHNYHKFVILPFPQHGDHRIRCGIHADSQLCVRLCHKRFSTDSAVYHHIKRI